MNLTRQSLLRYQGLFGFDGLCHIRVFEQPRKRPVVIAGNLDDNPGTMITNAIEMVADAIRRNITGGREFELIEHYPVTYPTAPTFSWVRFQRCQWHKDVEHADTIMRTYPSGTTVAYHYDPRQGNFRDPKWEPIQDIDNQFGCHIETWPEGQYTAHNLAGEQGEKLRHETDQYARELNQHLVDLAKDGHGAPA